MSVTITELLKKVVENNASDLHITVNAPPHLRINERLVAMDYHPFTAAQARDITYSLLTPEQIERFERDKELDLSFGIDGLARFRVNVFLQRGSIGCAIRALPFHIMTFEDCGLPVGIVTELCKKPKGLVLVTGATGSGKSTTLAAMIDKINSEKPCHIVTIEDPIEYVHKNKKAIVDQRELGCDTHSFGEALKHALRQDPNVIMIGEMRDLETISSALTIAETGHLVFATLHTSDSIQTMNRIIDVFPAHQQQQIRIQLSFVLLGVLAQQLIPKADGRGRVLATEVLLANYAIKSLIREQKVHQIYSVIQTSQKDGMRTMNQSLYELYINKQITIEDAMGRSTDISDLERLLGVKVS